jgi:prophage regulatory protein
LHVVESPQPRGNVIDLAKRRPVRLLPLSEVRARTSLSKTHIYRLEADGKFPKRVRLSECRSAWVEHEIEAWIDSLVSDRRG